MEKTSIKIDKWALITPEEGKKAVSIYFNDDNKENLKNELFVYFSSGICLQTNNWKNKHMYLLLDHSVVPQFNYILIK